MKTTTNDESVRAAVREQYGAIARQGGGVAGDVHESFRTQLRNRIHHFLRQPLARRIDDERADALLLKRFQPALQRPRLEAAIR